jgi:hypothetical protein
MCCQFSRFVYVYGRLQGMLVCHIQIHMSGFRSIQSAKRRARIGLCTALQSLGHNSSFWFVLRYCCVDFKKDAESASDDRSMYFGASSRIVISISIPKILGGRLPPADHSQTWNLGHEYSIDRGPLMQVRETTVSFQRGVEYSWKRSFIFPEA